MVNDIENSRKWLKDWVEIQRAAKLVERKEYYDYLAEDEDFDESFETWNKDMSYVHFDSQHATVDQLTQLETLNTRKFPDALKDFWLTLGLVDGEVTEGDMTIRIPSVSEFLSCFSEASKPYEKLNDLGLISIMNWVWGNDKAILNLEEGQIINNGDGTQTTREQIESINNSTTCFGFLTDGYFESNLFLHFQLQQDQKANFGATYWHQDNNVPLKFDIDGFETPEELIVQCLKGYRAIRDEDPEDPYFDIQALLTWLLKTSEK